MAFNFLGTFNEDDYRQLLAFAQAELTNVDARLAALSTQRSALETLQHKYAKAQFSFLGQSLESKAIDIFKLDPDTQRGRDAQEAFVASTLGGESQLTDQQLQLLKNQGLIQDGGAKKVFLDIEPANAITQLKDWLRPVIKTKRDVAEYSQFKCWDQQERVNKEIALVQSRRDAINDLVDQIENIIKNQDDFPSVTQSGQAST